MKDKTLPPLEYLPEATRPIPPEVKQREAKQSKGAYLAEAAHEESKITESVDFYAEHQKKQANMEKLKRAIKSNPLVPLGALLTAGILAKGLVAMKNKDTATSQAMMRWRVGAQGITVLALVVGTFAAQLKYSTAAADE